MELQGTLKNLDKQKEKLENSQPTSFRAFYKAIVIKILWDQNKNKKSITQDRRAQKYILI